MCNQSFSCLIDFYFTIWNFYSKSVFLFSIKKYCFLCVSFKSYSSVMFTYLIFWCFIYRCVWLMTTSSHLPLPMKPDRCLSSIVTVIPLWIASSISGPDGSYPNPWVQLPSKILGFSIIVLSFISLYLTFFFFLTQF